MQLLITLHNILSIFIVLVTKGKVSVSVSTLSPSSSIVETIDISSDWKQVRNESRRIGVYNLCKVHFNTGRDLCNKTVLEGELTSESSDFYPENCHCDDDCDQFNDCCIDKVASSAFNLSNFDPTSPSQPWSCVDLPISLHGLYAFKQCKPSFRSSEIEHLCISEPKSFLQWLPAFSSSSGIFYRNLFCAFCNLDHDSLHNWNLTITCDHNTSMLDISPYINEKHFNYSTGLWEFIAPDLGNYQSNGVSIDNKWRCKPSLPELEQYDSRSKFGTRSCLPVIDSCSTDWTDPIIASKCSAYTFLVGLPSTKTIYRNTFCARCNYVQQSNLRRLDCDLNKMAGPARSPTSFTYVSLRQLFDVSAYSSCSLTQYQIYNPASQSCMTVRCDVNYTVNPETGRCESITRDKDGTTLRSDCLRIFFESSDYTLNSDGSILLKERSTQLEHGLYQNFTQIDSVTGTKIEGILTCYDEHRLHYSSPMYSNYIQGILSIITSALSILGLTAYLTVTCLVPKLRNLRARMLMCLSGSLLAANVALICGYLARPALNESDDNIVPNTRGSLFCVITAINIHYWYLASFAWMNVMAYDAWKSFKRTHERLSNSMVHFLKYSLYSWLLPASVVLISVSFDLSNIPFDYRPMYGHRICWISQRKSLLAFFVAPVSTIIVINVIFFSLTTWFLYRTKQSTRIVVNSKSQENSQRYSLYVRLATLMGLTWIFWFFAAFSGINLLWYLFIILNGLQGAFIFFYFTCKKEVFKALQERIGFLIHGHEVVSGSSSSRATRSASLLPQSSSTTLQ